MLIPLLLAAACQAPAAGSRLYWEYPGGAGPGAGKRIVFVTGDEEYRSEEAMPELARILSRRHGFHCTVHFAVNAESGEIDPETRDNIPGLEALERADLMVLFTRFRDLPDDQMRHIAAYVDAGRPIVGLRTATHAFQMQTHTTYERYDWRSTQWDGGFGRRILGETWIAHHGAHGVESARGLVAPGQEGHPILRGIRSGDVWDPADVYRVRLPLPEGTTTLLLGQVLAGMSHDAPPLPAAPAGQPDKNDPMMPLAWIREYEGKDGARGRVFATTLGAAQAFTRDGTRRLLVNACFWAVGLEERIRPDADVSIVGPFAPSPFGFGGFRRGVKAGAGD